MVITDLRGWSTESSNSTLIDVFVGTLFSVVFKFRDDSSYVKLVNRLATEATPRETRLSGCCIGGADYPILYSRHILDDEDDHRPSIWLWYSSGHNQRDMRSRRSYTVFVASALTICIFARATCGAAFICKARRRLQVNDSDVSGSGLRTFPLGHFPLRPEHQRQRQSCWARREVLRASEASCE